MLTQSDLVRYGRQISYPAYGPKHQEQLMESHVTVVGLGGLGSAVAVYLAYAGIGSFTLIDYDVVELSNLNRQILYQEDDIGNEKPFAAAKRVSKINSAIKVDAVFERITSDNVRALIKGSDIVVDCLDNFAARLLLNSECIKQKKPLIHGGIDGFSGEVTTVIPGKTPCLACLFDEKIEEPDSLISVFGVAAGLVATIQATEVIKIVSNFGDLLAGKMLYLNSEFMDFVLVDLTKKPDCLVCCSGGNP